MSHLESTWNKVDLCRWRFSLNGSFTAGYRKQMKTAYLQAWRINWNGRMKLLLYGYQSRPICFCWHLISNLIYDFPPTPLPPSHPTGPKQSPTNPPRNHHGHGPRCQWTSRHSTLPSPNSCARTALCASWAPTRRIWSFGTFSSVVFDKEFDGEDPWLKRILFCWLGLKLHHLCKYVEGVKTKSWLRKYIYN